MNTWSETIILPKPLRAVHLADGRFGPPQSRLSLGLGDLPESRDGRQDCRSHGDHSDSHAVIGQNVDQLGDGKRREDAESGQENRRGCGEDPLKSAYELGRIDGEKALSEQLLKQRNETHELFQGVLTSLRQAVPQVISDTENMLVSLALEVAQKLVANMPISAELVEAAVHDALGQVEGTTQVTIRLHPADLESLQNAQSPLLGSPESPNEFRFLGSPEVTRGGCLVQTRFGTIDARRETKFDLLKRNLIQ